MILPRVWDIYRKYAACSSVAEERQRYFPLPLEGVDKVAPFVEVSRRLKEAPTAKKP